MTRFGASVDDDSARANNWFERFPEFFAFDSIAEGFDLNEVIEEGRPAAEQTT